MWRALERTKIGDIIRGYAGGVMRETIAERVKSLYAFIDAGKWSEVIELFDSDVTYDRDGTDPIEGLDALRAFYRSERQIDSARHQLEAVLVDGDRAAVRGRLVGVLKSGDPVEVEFADFHEFKEDRIYRRTTYFKT